MQEIFGVHEHIRDICRRLALEGYLAIAPELYFREGDPNDFALREFTDCGLSFLSVVKSC